MGYVDGMLVQSDGSKPHVVHLMTVLAKTFPNIILKIGGRVDRTTAGGSFSFHSVGRAMDVYLDANDPLDQKLGDLLYDLFSTEGHYLKVDHVIWNGQMWSTDKGDGPYTGSGGPHRDHVHVAFRNDHLGAAPLNFAKLLLPVVTQYTTGGDGAADRMDGLWGTAYQPKHPTHRQSLQQRKQIMLRKMGMLGSDK
jgi:hypothetical protein